MTVVRSAGLRGFRAAVAELGGDAGSLADAAGLPRAALDTDDLLVPERAVGRALETAARELGCPDLGLRVAARQDPGVLGPLAPAARHSETVRDALECTSRYLFVHAPSLEPARVEDPYGARGVTAVRYGGSAWAPRVRDVLVQLLGTAAPEIEAVARVLDLHPRTLQRRLAAEGTTFGAVLDETRRSAALRWLTTTDVPLGQIAGLVGLSESSALTRCARRWWGAPPRDVRRRGARTG